MFSEVIEGHIRSSFYLKIPFSSISYLFDIWSFQNLVGMNVNIIKTQLFQNMKFDLKGNFVWMLISWRHSFSLNYIWHKMSLLCYGEVLWFFFTLRPSDLITIDLHSYGQLLSLFSGVVANVGPVIRKLLRMIFKMIMYSAKQF